MEEKIINMNQFLGAAQGDQEHMLGKFLYFSLANLLVDILSTVYPISAKNNFANWLMFGKQTP